MARFVFEFMGGVGAFLGTAKQVALYLKSRNESPLSSSQACYPLHHQDSPCWQPGEVNTAGIPGACISLHSRMFLAS